MRIHDQHSGVFASPHLICPNCGGPMKLTFIIPATATPTADEITYRCEGCQIEMRRVMKLR
jgi:hypothetical protein